MLNYFAIDQGQSFQAVNYVLHEKKYLYAFLENGNVPIDNNRAENAIRPFAVGRKNWLFSNTANGAGNTAFSVGDLPAFGRSNYCAYFRVFD